MGGGTSLAWAGAMVLRRSPALRVEASRIELASDAEGDPNAPTVVIRRRGAAWWPASWWRRARPVMLGAFMGVALVSAGDVNAWLRGLGTPHGAPSADAAAHVEPRRLAAWPQRRVDAARELLASVPTVDVFDLPVEALAVSPESSEELRAAPVAGESSDALAGAPPAPPGVPGPFGGFDLPGVSATIDVSALPVAPDRLDTARRGDAEPTPRHRPRSRSTRRNGRDLEDPVRPRSEHRGANAFGGSAAVGHEVRPREERDERQSRPLDRLASPFESIYERHDANDSASGVA
jgi:hypothetical protein